MRIVFLVYRFWPAIGGVERYILHLSKALIQRGHQVAVLTGAHDPRLPAHDEHAGVRIYRFPAWRSRIRARVQLLRLRQVFADSHIISVSDILMLEQYRAALAWTMPGKPVFLTRHGLSCHCPVPVSQKRRAARARKFVTGTIDDGYFIAKWIGVPCDAVLDQGLDPPADDLPVVPEPAPDSAAYVGRLDWDCGVEKYIEALWILKNRHKLNIHLHIAGRGACEQPLRRAISERGVQVTMHGWLANAQELYNDACIAFASGRMAIQEALARRRLVIATYVNELRRDYVSGEPFSRFVHIGGTPEEIASAVLHYVNDSGARATMRLAGFEYARTLSWDRTAKMYEEFWRSRLKNLYGGENWRGPTRISMSLDTQNHVSRRPEEVPQ